MENVNAIVVGGGIAASTVAASLAREGLQVLLCEAGLPDERRLAGEWMHPPAAQDLEDLGLLRGGRRPLRSICARFEIFGSNILRRSTSALIRKF